MRKVFLVLVLGLSFYASISQITHFEALGYDNLPISGWGNWHVLTEDWNGDGYDDIYITRDAQHDVLFYGSANGQFTKQDISNESWNTTLGSLDIIAKDLNGDGLKDIIITKTPFNGGLNDAVPSKDVILKNMGNGNYVDVSNNLPAEASAVGFCNFPDIDATNFTTGVATGLLNNDAIPDIIMVNGGVSYLPRLELFTNSPIVCREKLKNDIYFSTGIDANADDIDDYTYVSNKTPINSHRDLSTDVLVADFDGDNLDDIFVANFFDQTILSVAQLNDSSGFSKLFVNTPSNQGAFTWKFGINTGFPLEKYPATSADAADFDRDGDIDLIVGIEKRGDTLFNIEYSLAMSSKIFLNDGAANFTDATSSLFPPFKKEYLSCYDIQFVDVNNDGWLDVFGAGITCFLFIQDDTVNHTFSDMTYLLPSSKAHPSSNITHTYHAYGAGFSDFDSNGMIDVILACTYEQPHLLFQMTDGQFIDTTTTNLPPDGQNTEYAVVADFTGDNLPDVIKVNNDIETNTHAFYIQTSSVINDHPYFIDKGYQVPLDTAFVKNYGIDYHDIDGDNDFDILIAGESGIKIYENDGLGNFTENTTWLTGITGLNYSTRVKFVDIDGDNDKDIFIPRAQNVAIGQSNIVLLWNGSHYVDATSSLLPSNSNPSLDVDFADINGDNWMDFAVANDNGGGALYLSNSGDMYTISYPFTTLPSSTSLKFIQLDSDDFIDLVQINKDITQNVMIYKNSGIEPYYDHSMAINDSGEESYDLGFYDFNDDGLNDLFIAGFAASNRIFINEGNMNFQDLSLAFFPEEALRVSKFTKAVAIKDVNQDGLVDIYLARDNQDLLLYGQGDITDIKETPRDLESRSITIFPNPARDYISIDLKSFEKESAFDLMIISSDGKVMRDQKQLIGNNICIKDLPEGVYFLMIRQKNKHFSIAKLIKTK